MQPNKSSGDAKDTAAADSAPQRSCSYTLVKWVVRFLTGVAIAALISLNIVHVLAMKGCIESKGFSDYEKSFVVLSGVGFMCIAILQLVAEAKPKWFLSRVAFMRVMAVRGFLLGWQGIQVIDVAGSQAGKAVRDIDNGVFKIFSDVVGWVLIGVGLIFVIISSLRLKKVLGVYDEEDGFESPVAQAPTSGDPVDRERAKAAQPSGGKAVLTPDARTVISNMAIALDLTSAVAWDMFNGPSGAEEARRIRNDRAQALAAAMNYSLSEQNTNTATRGNLNSAPPTASQLSTQPNNTTHTNFNQNTSTSARQQPVPPTSTADDADAYNTLSHRERSRLANDDDALIAQYYGSTK